MRSSPCTNTYWPLSGVSGSARIASTCLRTSDSRIVVQPLLGHVAELARRGAREAGPEHRHRLHEAALERLQRVQTRRQQRPEAGRNVELAELPGQRQAPFPLARARPGWRAPGSSRWHTAAGPRRGRSLRRARAGAGPRPARRAARPWSRSPAARAAARSLRGARRASPPRPDASSGRASVSMKIGLAADHSSTCSMKSSIPSSAHCRSSNTSTTGICSARRSRNRRQPANSSVRPRPGSATPSRTPSRGHRKSRSPASGTQRSSPACELGAGLLDRRLFGDPEALADHFGQRPVGDPVAVGEAAAGVPEDVLGQPVDVLVELPQQARLADSGGAIHGHQPRRAALERTVEELLQQPQIGVAADQRGLDATLSLGSAEAGDHTRRPPQVNRLGLAFDGVVAGVLVGDRRAR